MPAAAAMRRIKSAWPIWPTACLTPAPPKTRPAKKTKPVGKGKAKPAPKTDAEKPDTAKADGTKDDGES